MLNWPKKELLMYIQSLEDRLPSLDPNKVDRKKIFKIIKIISKINNILRQISRVFRDNKITLSVLRRFLENEIKPICFRLYNILKQLLDMPSFCNCEELSKLVFLLNDIGCCKIAKELFQLQIRKIDDDFVLAEILDKIFESGFLDLALIGLRKIRENGYTSYEIIYNEALINYLLGNNFEALKLLKTISNQFGQKKPVISLLAPIYIAIGNLEEAKKLFRILRR